MSNVLAVTDGTFAAEVEQHAGLVVVDFWATWCGPCRMIKPIVEQLATDYVDTVRFTSVDGDSNQRTMARFGVRGLPTLLFFQHGRVVDSIVGAVPRARIEERLRAHLAPAAV
ncbi:MAG: thioredoxin [Gemmatimonadaceae bacterium]